MKLLRETEVESIVITASLWIMIFLFFLLFPSKQLVEQKEFATVQIRLEPIAHSSVEQKSSETLNENAAPSSVSEILSETQTAVVQNQTTQSLPETKPVATQPTELAATTTPAKAETLTKTTTAPTTTANTTPSAPAKAETPKTATTAPVSTTKKTTPVTQSEPTAPTLVQSVEEAMAAQNKASSKPKVEEIDWDAIFGDTEATSTSTSSNTQKTSNANEMSSTSALSGSAGTVTSSDVGAVAKSSGKTNNTTSQSASASTLESLGRVTGFYATSGTANATGNSASSEVSINVSVDSNGTSIVMSDGTARRLLYPSDPTIRISDENAKLIKETIRNITITFTVRADGTVLSTQINISPQSLLPSEIVSEIRNQLSTWRFETAQRDGQATFSYSIIKR